METSFTMMVHGGSFEDFKRIAKGALNVTFWQATGTRGCGRTPYYTCEIVYGNSSYTFFSPPSNSYTGREIKGAARAEA